MLMLQLNRLKTEEFALLNKVVFLRQMQRNHQEELRRLKSGGSMSSDEVVVDEGTAEMYLICASESLCIDN